MFSLIGLECLFLSLCLVNFFLSLNFAIVN